MTSDVLADSFPFSWRGISAPTKLFETKFTEAHAIHTRVDRDGGRVETLGREPYEFHVQILFLNGLTPGKGEGWAGDLYPGVYKTFIAAVEDRSSGPLMTPTFGSINCKCVQLQEHLDADSRSGPTVDATFIESDDTTVTNLGSVSVFATAFNNANNLDNVIAADTDIDNPFDDDGSNSFSSFVSGIPTNATEFFGAQFTTKIAGAINSAHDIGDQFTLSGDASDARIIDASYQTASSLRALQTAALKQAKAISAYTVPSATTLGALAGRLKSNPSDLISLNPSLGRVQVIDMGTTVVFYL